MGAVYTYLIADLRSGEILDELPLSGVSFDKKLNDTGSFRAQLSVADPEIRLREPRLLTEPGRTAIYVDRGGDLLWGGIIWTSRYSGADAVLELGAADFLSYFEHRLVLHPEGLARPVPFTNTDQLTIARALVGLAQSHPAGDLGIVVTGTASSDVPRTITYGPGDLKPVADALRDLANAQDGFDFAVDVRYTDSGVPERALHVGFPRLGRAGAPHVWEYGANLIDFTWPTDAASMATRVVVPGGSPIDEDLSAHRAGWPLLEVSASQSDATDAALLVAYVKGELAARRRPVVLPELTVRADLDPVVGSYSVGDDARIVIDDPFFPSEQVDVTVRIVGLEVTPGDDAGQEQVKLTVAPFLEPS